MPPRGTTGSQGAVTQQDIADQVGCSKNTVSLALRDSPRISPALRAEIQQAAAVLGYIPNYAARHLSTRRSGMIGLYTRNLNDAVRTELVNKLISGLHTADYRPVLGLGHDAAQPWYDSPWMQTFQELHVEALVVVNESMDRLPDWPRTIPTVFVGSHPRARVACDYIALDRTEGAALGIRHLRSQGHADILVACDIDSPFGQGCVETLQTEGLAPIRLNTEDHRGRCFERLIEDALRGRRRPTAALFGDAPLAARTMHYLQERGVRIPGELAVVAYDYFPWADMLRVPLSTIEQPLNELAAKAVHIVEKRLSNHRSPLVQEVIAHTLQIRKSG